MARAPRPQAAVFATPPSCTNHDIPQSTCSVGPESHTLLLYPQGGGQEVGAGGGSRSLEIPVTAAVAVWGQGQLVSHELTAHGSHVAQFGQPSFKRMTSLGCLVSGLGFGL